MVPFSLDKYKRILQAQSPYETELHRDLLLAGECLRDGVQVNHKLHRGTLSRLLILYLTTLDCEPIGSESETYAFRRHLEEPTAAIIESLDDDRSSVMAGLLAIAQEECDVSRSLLGELVANLMFGIPVVRSIAPSFIRHKCLARKRVPSPTEVGSLVKYAFTESRTYEKERAQRVAIKALGRLMLSGPETTDVMLKALASTSNCFAATEALSKIGPATEDVAMALMNAARQFPPEDDPPGAQWRHSAGEIMVAVGILAQRSSSVVSLLLKLTRNPELDRDWTRYAATYALCKAAETSPEAMVFVLDGFRNLHRKQASPDGRYEEVVDDSIRGGLLDGKELIVEASGPVLDCLLRDLRSLASWSGQTGSLLARITGDSPLVRQREITSDGHIRRVSRDLTEDVLEAFLQQPYGSSLILGHPTLALLARWCLTRPGLMARLISEVRIADRFLMASYLEWSLPPDRSLLGQPVDPEMRRRIEESVARLRSADAATSEAELEYCLATEENFAGEHDLRYLYLPTTLREKIRILHSLWTSWAIVWAAHEDRWTQKLDNLVVPHVFAALACFRGWDEFAFPRLELETDEVEQEFTSQVEHALALLHQPHDEEVIASLWSVVNGEPAHLSDRALEQRLADQEDAVWGDVTADEPGLGSHRPLSYWRARTIPDFRARISARYLLAQLAGDHPEIQTRLLSMLEQNRRSQEQSGSSQISPPEYLVRALGYVRHAGRDLMEALLEILGGHDEDLYDAASLAISWLDSPDPAAVELLAERYGQIRSSRKDRLIKALGKVESPSPKVMDILQTALHDEDHDVATAAAVALGEIKMPDPKTEAQVVAVLAQCIERNPAAVAAAGTVATRMTFPGAPDSKERLAHRKRLEAIAKRLRVFMDRNEWSNAESLGYEALYGIATRLTDMEVARLSPNLPFSQGFTEDSAR